MSLGGAGQVRPYGVKMMVEVLRDEEMFAQSSRDPSLAEARTPHLLACARAVCTLPLAPPVVAGWRHRASWRIQADMRIGGCP